MHSFLYFKRAGGSHISTMFYTCNMQKRENKAIFLRISGEMAKKQRNMQPTAKRNGSMQGFAPRKHPRQACSLDCIAKLRFAFQPAPAGKTVTPYISLQPATVFRPQPADTFPADFLQSTTLSGPNYLPPGASRPTTFRRISFHTSTTILRQSITSIPA